MRLLTTTLLLSSLLLPTHLLAVHLSQGSDDPGMGSVDKYVSFYGAYVASNNYSLSGTKGDENMDVTKMQYESGLGGGFALGFWPSNNVAFELSLKYLDRLDKVSEVETKSALAKLVGSGNLPDDLSLLAGHVEKLATNSWKMGLAAKYYFGFIRSECDSAVGPWSTVEGGGSNFPLAFYMEFGASASYVTKEVKGDLIPAGNPVSGYSFSGPGADAGAALDDTTDKTNLKKFNKSEFVLALQGGAGIDLVMGEAVLSLGYQVDYASGDQKFKQRIEGVEYEFISDKNIVHNLDLAVKLVF